MDGVQEVFLMIWAILAPDQCCIGIFNMLRKITLLQRYQRSVTLMATIYIVGAGLLLARGIELLSKYQYA
jgi:hypothetical protein